MDAIAGLIQRIIDRCEWKRACAELMLPIYIQRDMELTKRFEEHIKKHDEMMGRIRGLESELESWDRVEGGRSPRPSHCTVRTGLVYGATP